MYRRSVIACAIAALIAGGLCAGTASAAEPMCAAAAQVAESDTRQEAVDAVLCLVNRERSKRGIAPLQASRLLTNAASAHSLDMVTRKFFDHVSPGGENARQRVARAGYATKSQRCAVGETIAWGSGSLGTPAELVRSFMTSSGHKQILLDRRYRDIGIGLALAAPVDGIGGASTLTLDFGRRS